MAVAFGACTTPVVTAQLGFARTEIGGDLALATAGAGTTVQDVRSAFGLGDAHGSPFGRVVADFGAPVLSVSGFWLHEAGAGVLGESFGGLPAATTVTTDFDLGVFKFAAVYELPLGPITLAPGVAFDVFALDFRVAESPGNREEVDEILGLPLPFVRATAPLPCCGLLAVAEIGWVDLDVLGLGDDRFVDLEASLEHEFGHGAHLFGGYRWLAVDAEGDAAPDTVLLDLAVHGWFVGVGITF